MRLHLIIQRHGLPVTRILWTTAPPSLFGQNTSSALPAFTSAITSTLAPNALFANGGYTIAQLLEDVNEIVPLETEPALFDSECSGQWGLEDYVVEVGGSECLHFMEVEGLLRDGDEILIRALQISDLRARRLSGRHQISTDGKHLIDGVPFGKPFLKRPTSSRPAITIPPRKRRRTTFETQDNMVGYEEDSEWGLPHIRSFKELSALRGVDEPETVIMGDNGEQNDDDDDDEYEDYHESHEDTGNGTVIRHYVDDAGDAQASESDADMSEADAGDLEEELKDLKEDLEVSAMPETEATDDGQAEPRGYALRSRPTTSQTEPTNGPAAHPGKTVLEEDSSRRDSKAVRFSLQKEESPVLPSQESSILKAQPASEKDSDSSVSVSVSGSSASDSSDTDSDDSVSSSEESSELDDDSSSDSEISSSGSEDKEVSAAPHTANPPGHGSLKTKKSNQRHKMRRRLSKLKQLGALPAEADFAALRDWEGKNKGQRFVPESATDHKSPGAAEFEARRQKLLRDIESGGLDVTRGTFIPTKPVERGDQEQAKELPENREGVAEEGPSEVGPEPKRRTLDVASSRRLLFGSLGVRTPRTKEDEETTRKKLAGKVNNFVPQKKVSDELVDVPQSDLDEGWENKLIIRATECVYNDIQLTAPPFPFEQRWDYEAGDLIRQRKGLGKKRKRRQQLQVYDEDECAGDEDSFVNGDLHYDALEQLYSETNNYEPSQTAKMESDDLPSFPNDPSSLRDLVEDDLKCGCVLAFKQLDVSKTTNWQPTVTDYRVAEIHEVYDGNNLNVRLAKRDRRKVREMDLEEDGPQYSGFEMPGYEDEGEDDGFREVSFADLIDPKLLRAPDLGEVKQASHSTTEASQRDLSSSPNPPKSPVEYSNNEQSIQERSNLPDHLTHELSASYIIHDVKASTVDSSPKVRSPQFDGFQPPSPKSGHASKASLRHWVANSNPWPAADQKANDSNSQHSDSRSLADRDVQPILHSTPPPILPDNLSSLPRSEDDLQILSTPESEVSFSRLINQLFDGNEETNHSPPTKKEVRLSPERPASPSSSGSMVPNPFYKIDKAREARRRRSSQQQRYSIKEGDTTMDYVSAVEFPSSPSPHRPSRVRQRKSYASQDEKEKIPDSPSARASSAAREIVDLTQSSPAISPEGSDKDFARTYRLPRGPGWVQKNVPSTRRQTRLSSVAPKMQVVKEVSISPSPRRGRRRKLEEY
ncbi:hypothetical protein BDV28DRAFT_11032 [Aspergillus coremiiformis]|uniref:Uncharacterized protein n=1 Tax=Aspergillus coremiiformis TaxID=138285 RepID=A0A5N6Z436_9EURO|nr:hypothetical protein BDV28DRAFT_11032 [Aspergillus coremiiformis]